MAIRNLIKISVISSVGCAGYFAGRFHEKLHVYKHEKHDGMPGFPVLFSNVYAATPIENNLVPIGQNLPEVKKDPELVPVEKRVSQVSV